jgi:hypothetical protein
LLLLLRLLQRLLLLQHVLHARRALHDHRLCTRRQRQWARGTRRTRRAKQTRVHGHALLLLHARHCSYWILPSNRWWWGRLWLPLRRWWLLRVWRRWWLLLVAIELTLLFATRLPWLPLLLLLLLCS